MYLRRIAVLAQEQVGFNAALLRYVESLPKYLREESGESQDAEESEEAPAPSDPAKKPSPEQLEQLKNVVRKDRSKYLRQSTLDKFTDDQAFLFEVATAPKQYEDVRESAARLLNDAALIDRMVTEGGEGAVYVAMEKTKNPTLIKKFAEEMYRPAVLELKDEKLALKYLLADAKDKKSAYNPNRYRYDNDTSDYLALVMLIKSPDSLFTLVQKALETNLADNFSNNGVMFALSRITDPAMLKKIATMKVGKGETDRYGSSFFVPGNDENYYNRREPTAVDFVRYALLKLGDKALAKTLAEAKDTPAPLRLSALLITGFTQDVAKKVWKSDKSDTFRIALLSKFDETTLKEVALKKLDPEEDDDVIIAALSHINDVEFMKQFATAELNKNGYSRTLPTALEKVADDAWKVEQAKGLGNKPHPNSRKALYENIKDQGFLKEKYAEAKDNEGIRRSALKNITDDDFLLKVAKNDGILDVRMAAVKAIKDTEKVALMMMREKTKGGRSKLIEMMKENQTVLQSFILKVRDTDSDSADGAIRRVTDKTVAEELIKESVIDRHLFEVLGDQWIMARIEEMAPDSFQAAFTAIKNTKLVKPLYEKSKTKLRGYQFSAFIELKDDEINLDIALTLRDRTAREALEAIGALTQEQALKLVLEARYEDVRERALPFVTDPEMQKKILLDSSGKFATKLLPNFVKDVEFLHKAAMLSRNTDVRLRLVPRIKDNEVLKYIAENDESLGLLALEQMTDVKHLVSIALKSKDTRVVDAALGGLVKAKDIAALARVLPKLTISGYLHDNENLSAAYGMLHADGYFDDLDYVTDLFANKGWGQIQDVIARYPAHKDFVVKLATTSTNPDTVRSIWRSMTDDDKLAAIDSASQLLSDIALLFSRRTPLEPKYRKRLVDATVRMEEREASLPHSYEEYLAKILPEFSAEELTYLCTKVPKLAYKVLTHADNDKSEALAQMLYFKGEFKAAAVFLPTADLTADMVGDWMAGMRNHPSRSRIPVDAFVLMYQLATDPQVKEELARFLPKSLRRSLGIDESSKFYKTLQTKYRSQKGDIKKIDHEVKTDPNHELLRLLVRLAR